ncbi:hypothetical protein GCM10025865_12730 [Paraoerskovia sediminicola]|uniref:Glycosyl hydrolase family 30 TIM-barrel domain-containing protein n=1 Tax=Paraoerskovia sediminicola TaxID=1138587 RepID=A0ABM8G1N9_9CELL|nr:hypothetical protein [Paraoerskovia sediminicola]BDZ41974.1 hypothetical protein GCM10025865_12730 [Paraoerskovia sediminicola]
MQQALEINPDLKVLASPWGQPAWMKANGSIVGGRLIDDPAIFESYALYLTKFVQAYEDAGIPVYALTVQNEPQNRTPDAYPGTDMPVAHEAAVINELGPMLQDAGLGDVQIIGFDHNWAQHPDDAADATSLGLPAEPDYAADLLRSSAAQWIAGTGYHCYFGDPRRRRSCVTSSRTRGSGSRSAPDGTVRTTPRPGSSRTPSSGTRRTSRSG